MKLEKIRENLENLLDEYDYDYSNYALNKIVNEWNKQKEPLRNVLRNHPNWNEEEDMIVFDIDINRELDKEAVERFRSWAISNLNLDYCNQNQTMWDYKLFPCDQFMTNEKIELIKRKYPDFKAVAGQKTSRAMNKLFAMIGLDKHPNYNREFAKYADAINPLKVTRHTVISINLIDYLTMSFGNSWASCHTIDKENQRGRQNAYQGCYSSGTLSYALDSTSIVLYTVDSSYNGNEYYLEDKINRQMFHFGEDKLAQGRLYPQDCDSGANDTYTQFRNLMQEVIAYSLGIPNLWLLRRGIDICKEHIVSFGTHYRDYYHFDNCSISFLKNSENENKLQVGANPICIECGCTHSREDNINCCRNERECNCCGCVIDEDEAHYIDGEYYCDECAYYCEDCGEWHTEDDMTYVECVERYVCSDCLREDYTYCDHCEEYYPDFEIRYVESSGYDVCDNCLDEYYYCCEKCEEYFLHDDIVVDDNGYCYCRNCYDEITENEEGEDDYEDEAV